MAASIWETDARFWPKAPSDYVFLAAAFQEVGARLFPTEWTGEEALPVKWPKEELKIRLEAPPRVSSAPAPIVPITQYRKAAAVAPKLRSSVDLPSPEEMARLREAALSKATSDAEAELLANNAILDRRRAVAAWIADRARDGKLVTFGVREGWEPTPLNKALWNISNDWDLFATCEAKAWHGAVKLEYSLFLTRDSLSKCLRTEDEPMGGALKDCRVSLSDLSELDRAAGERWACERFMRIFDAALWIAGGNPEASAALAGFRAFQRRREPPDRGIDDAATELVGLSWVPDGTIGRGKALLFDALRTGEVTAFGSSSPDGEMKAIEAVEWSRPFALNKRGGADCLTGPELPYPIRYHDVVVCTRSVFKCWPLPANDATATNRADVLARSPQPGERSADLEAVDPEPLPVVTRAQLQAWIREQIATGITQEAVGKSFRSAFPDRRVKQSREDVREIYRAEFAASHGELRPGPRVTSHAARQSHSQNSN